MNNTNQNEQAPANAEQRPVQKMSDYEFWKQFEFELRTFGVEVFRPGRKTAHHWCDLLKRGTRYITWGKPKRYYSFKRWFQDCMSQQENKVQIW